MPALFPHPSPPLAHIQTAATLTWYPAVVKQASEHEEE